MSEQMNKSGIIPTGHYILVKPDPVETKTSGGIVLVQETIDTEQRNTTKGILVAIGPIGWAEFGNGEPWAKLGDHVCYGQYAGRNMKGIDDERYVLMNCEDILAVINDQD